MFVDKCVTLYLSAESCLADGAVCYSNGASLGTCCSGLCDMEAMDSMEDGLCQMTMSSTDTRYSMTKTTYRDSNILVFDQSNNFRNFNLKEKVLKIIRKR